VCLLPDGDHAGVWLLCPFDTRLSYFLHTSSKFLLFALALISQSCVNMHMNGARNAHKTIASKHRTNVILPEDVLSAGSERAREERRNFSNYITWLIEQDVKRTAAEKMSSTQEVGA
jgi:hypothetical protein